MAKIFDILDTKIKAKIAGLFSKNKGPLHVSEVARALSISKSRASECLRDLEKSGLLKSRSFGRSVVYELLSTKFAESIVASMNEDEKFITALEVELKKQVKPLKPVSMVRFGSSMKELKRGSDIDIFLVYVEKISNDKLYRLSADLTKDFGIPISITAMELEEFRAKAKRGEDFVLKLIATHKHLYGKNLEDLIWSEK